MNKISRNCQSIMGGLMRGCAFWSGEDKEISGEDKDKKRKGIAIN